MKIGVFDSGKGGLSVLQEIRVVLPNEDIFYYVDSLNNTYGEKSDQDLCKITSSIVERLKKEGCSVIVIACNTATTRCIKYLREEYPDTIFIGTVPAIKVACDHDFKNTVVMATPATIESERINELVRDNKRTYQNIYLVSCHGLAHAIEIEDKMEIKRILEEVFKDYKNKNIDSIVLGCTHYPFIKKEILEEMPNVTLIDGANGVAREVKRQMELHNLLSYSNSLGKVVIYNSLDNTTYEEI